MHTLVDEIYALSADRQRFQSVVRILENKLHDDVHLIWSLSKDFGASGLRVGFVYSQNEVFLKGLSNLNIFGAVSNPMQVIVSELLTDDSFVDFYLDESRARLHQSYQICVQKLEEMCVCVVAIGASRHHLHSNILIFLYVSGSFHLFRPRLQCLSTSISVQFCPKRQRNGKQS